MDQTDIKAATRLRDKMDPPSFAFPDVPAEEHLTRPQNPNYGNPAPQSQGEQDKPQAKSFKELFSRLGQHSQLAVPSTQQSDL
jgi:hypothetical protein